MTYLVGVLCLLGFAATSDAADMNLWASQGAVVTASALDAHSSWNRAELNPLLAGPDGSFGPRGAAVKGVVVAGVILAEWCIVRKWPRARRTFTRLNIGLAVGTGAIAARNYYVTSGSNQP